jgi:5-methylcytosine-specific restriction endonuclease McrA
MTARDEHEARVRAGHKTPAWESLPDLMREELIRRGHRCVGCGFVTERLTVEMLCAACDAHADGEWP